MAERCALSVVIPAYRESGALATLLPRLLATLPKCADSFEILVVDTRDTLDDTSVVCRCFAVRHLRRSGGEAYGDAVRTGIARARGEFVLFMDADGSHDPEAIREMFGRRHEFDIVIGSRYVCGGRSENGPLLVAMSLLLCFVFRLTFGVPVADATTSFRLYRGDILRTLTLQASGFDILQEILLKALGRPMCARVGEIPVTFRKRTAGSSKRRLLLLGIAYAKTFMRLKRDQMSAVSSP